MANFLIRSFDPKDPGYTIAESTDGLLPRRSPGDQAVFGSGDGAFVPWAITANGKVVYARMGENRGTPPNTGGLRLYDALVSQDRRRLAELALGIFALNLPQVTKAAVDLVTNELLACIAQLTRSPQKLWEFKQAVFKGIGHYYYTNGGQGFGRISEQDKKAVGAYAVYDGIMNALKTGRVDQRIGIHETMCRKVLFDANGMNLGPADPHRKKYDEYGPILRQDWFDDKEKRGRVDVPKANQPKANTFGGVITPQQGLEDARQGAKVGQTAIPRSRGVRYVRAQRDPDARAGRGRVLRRPRSSEPDLRGRHLGNHRNLSSGGPRLRRGSDGRGDAQTVHAGDRRLSGRRRYALLSRVAGGRGKGRHAVFSREIHSEPAGTRS